MSRIDTPTPFKTHEFLIINDTKLTSFEKKLPSFEHINKSATQ